MKLRWQARFLTQLSDGRVLRAFTGFYLPSRRSPKPPRSITAILAVANHEHEVAGVQDNHSRDTSSRNNGRRIERHNGCVDRGNGFTEQLRWIRLDANSLPVPRVQRFLCREPPYVVNRNFVAKVHEELPPILKSFRI